MHRVSNCLERWKVLEICSRGNNNIVIIIFIIHEINVYTPF
jgi:hypothetical protein